MAGSRAEEVAAKSEVNQVPAKAEEKVVEAKRPKAPGYRARVDAFTDRDQITHELSGKFHFDVARFFRAALALCGELCASFAAEAQPFAFAAQLEPLSY